MDWAGIGKQNNRSGKGGGSEWHLENAGLNLGHTHQKKKKAGPVALKHLLFATITGRLVLYDDGRHSVFIDFLFPVT